MARRLLPALQQVFSDIGQIGIGYRLETYQTLTTTPLATYSDEGLTIPNANPATGATTGNQISDENGRFGDIWVSDLSLYKIILTDANDVPLITVDPVDGSSGGSIIIFDPIPEAFWGVTEGTSTVYTLDSLVDISNIGYTDTEIFKCQYNVTCAAAPTLNINNLDALNLKKYTGTGTKVALEVGDVVGGQTYDHRIDGIDIVVLNPEIVWELKANTVNSAVFSNQKVIIANDISNPNNNIDFSAGTAFDKTNNVGFVCTAIIKVLNANWVSGTGNGGLDTGTKQINTWYHCYVIFNASTNLSDAIFSTDASSPTLPTGYNNYTRVGSILTDGSGNIISFFSDGPRTTWLVPVQNNYTNPGTSAVLRTLATPLGINTYPLWVYHHWQPSPSGNSYSLVTSPDQTDSTPSATLYTTFVASGADVASSDIMVRTNTSSQIRERHDVADSNTHVDITVYGWFDPNI